MSAQGLRCLSGPGQAGGGQRGQENHGQRAHLIRVGSCQLQDKVACARLALQLSY